MAITRRKEPALHRIVQLLPLQTLMEAQNLALRFRDGKAFRLYVQSRLWLIIPVLLLMVVIGVTGTAAFLVYATGVSGWLLLPAILLLPVILIGSLFVQAYVFFSWLENRALARALGRGAKPPQGALAVRLWKTFGLDTGAAPAIPWVLAALFFVGPLALMATFAFEVALGLLALAILVPVVYAKLDR